MTTITDWIQKTWKKLWSDEILGIVLAITILAMIIKVAEKGKTLDNVLLAGLIGVTTWYAYATIKIARATKQQADASVKMAEEMKKQRLDSARPVIDIQVGGIAVDLIATALEAESGDFSSGLSCNLQNIGLGPAVDIYSHIQFQGKSLKTDLGTLAVEERTKKEEKLSVFQEDSHPVLSVHYKDIYGRDFESSREVQIGKKTSSAESSLGPLKSILVEEHKR